MAPGHILHIGLRKRFLEDETRAAIADGARQVLVVGSGFDTLAIRLAAAFPAVTFIELDHPATHEAKRAALETLGVERPNLHLAGVDLAAVGLRDTLDGLAAWRRDATGVAVAEGVLMYLEQTAVAAFFDAIRRTSAAGSRVLFTYLRRDEAGRIWLGKLGFLMRGTLRLIGEPLRWGVRDGELPAFLDRLGLRFEPSPERYDLRLRYLAPAGLAGRPAGHVEFMAVVETPGA